MSLPDNADAKLGRYVSAALKTGVTISAALLCCGIALEHAPGLAAAGTALAKWGIYILLLTPMARVAAAGWCYRKSGEYGYFALTLLVFAILASGFLPAP